MKRLLSTLILFVSGFALAPAWAAYPDRPIRLIVPFPAGGVTDGVARVAAQKLGEILGQSVVVDNRPGADTQIGNQAVATAAPDGYTLVAVTTSFAINKSLLPNLPYDSVADFTPITSVAVSPFLLAAGAQAGLKDIQDLIARAKKEPGKLNYAVSSSTSFVAGELMKTAAGIDVVDVHYKGGAPAVVAVAAGEVLYTMDAPLSVKSMLDSGKMQVLAVTGSNRLAAYPKAPTFAEIGLGDADVRSWLGISGPRGLPPSIADAIHKAMQQAIASPDVVQKLQTFAAQPMPMTRPQFTEFLTKEFNRFDAIVKSNDLVNRRAR